MSTNDMKDASGVWGLTLNNARISIPNCLFGKRGRLTTPTGRFATRYCDLTTWMSTSGTNIADLSSGGGMTEPGAEEKTAWSASKVLASTLHIERTSLPIFIGFFMPF
jgi:hypothetical protein